MKKGDLKRILTGFFVVMLFLTVLSRAAASVTVPQVAAQSVKEGTLTYKLYGTGVVEEEKTRSVEVLSGLVIEEVYGEAGAQVKEGEALFSYSMESLEEALEQTENQWKKLELSCQQEKLGTLGEDDAVKGAKISLEQAEDSLKQAKEAVKDGKKQIRKEAKAVVKELEKEYEDLFTTWEEKKLSAAWAAEDAKAAYEEQRQIKDKVEMLLTVYQQSIEKADGTAKWNNRQELLKLYYGKEYQSYQNEKTRVIKVVTDAQKDVNDIRAKWADLIQEEDRVSEEQEVVDNYNKQCQERDSEIKAAERLLESARFDLMEFLKEENVLTEAMNQYEKGTEGSYEKLYGLFAEKLAIDENAISKAEKSFERALESQKRLEQQAEKELLELLEKKAKAEEKVTAIKAGSYDYEADLKEKKQAVKQAEYALEQAKHNVESTENGIEQAAKARALRLETLAIDMAEKKQELDMFLDLKKQNGKVLSPFDGTVAEQPLESGVKTTGQERVLLAADLYCLKAETEAEICQHFQVGDEIILSRDGISETFSISGISAEEDGRRSITIELPQEGYSLGSSWSFKAEKASASFKQKIPIQCLRRDNSGYYVLVVSERDGILGTEQYASRIVVEFLAKDDNYAAISGALGREDKIVVSGSRNVESGDRVRLMEE